MGTNMDAAKENIAAWRKSFILRQTYFIVNNSNAIAWKYVDFRSGTMRRFSKSEHLPEDGQIWPKHVAIDMILMLF
jgi:hypothetical protein